MAAALRQGRLLSAVSRGLAAITLLWWILRQVHGHDISAVWTTLVIVSLIGAVIQLYWAIRVGLDAELLTALAQRPWQTAAHDLDASLAALGLRAAPGIERGWGERWRGMRTMLVRQSLCVVLQVIGVAAAGWVV